MKLAAQLNPQNDVADAHIDAAQGNPGAQVPPNSKSVAAAQPKPINPIKKKKPIKSIAELKAIAVKMNPKNPTGY